MSDWMFDDGSATSLLSQDYGAGLPPPVWDEPPSQGAPSEDPLFSEDLPDGGEVDPITVTPGHQPGPPIDGAGWGGTDTTQLDPNSPMEDLPCTPPPDGDTPEGDGAEYGAYIYELNGELHTSEPFTNGQPGQLEVRLGPNTVPPGARIVAWVHTHPDDGVVRQNRISEHDVNVLNEIAAVNAARGYGWVGDPNVMAYIKEVGGPGSDNLSEYHESDFANRTGTVLGPCYGS